MATGRVRGRPVGRKRAGPGGGEAIALHERTLADRERLLGRDHPDRHVSLRQQIPITLDLIFLSGHRAGKRSAWPEAERCGFITRA